MNMPFTYKGALEASEAVNWTVDDLINADSRLDFTKPFMPETFARVTPLTFLTPDEQRTLNQIRGYGYLYTFGLVEEFILPFVIDHARPHVHGDDYEIRALLQFASEEAKHIQLFNRFCQAFEKGFGSRCDMIGPAEEISRAVLTHHPLGIALAILQTEWATQKHYTESIRDNEGMDPLFKSLLKHHWQEEMQHAMIDNLIVESMAATYDEDEITRGLEDYAKIGALLDGGLMQQVQFDIENFTRATGRRLAVEEAAEFTAVQRQAVRWTYLGSAMTHPQFLRTIERIKPGMRQEIEDSVREYC